MIPRYLAAGRSPALTVNAWALAPAVRTVTRSEWTELLGVDSDPVFGGGLDIGALKQEISKALGDSAKVLEARVEKLSELTICDQFFASRHGADSIIDPLRYRGDLSIGVPTGNRASARFVLADPKVWEATPSISE